MGNDGTYTNKPNFDRKINKIQNKNYSTDVDRMLRYTRWLLEILGVWPMVKKNIKKWEPLTSTLRIGMCLMLIAFFMIPCTLHIIFIEKNPTVRLTLVGPIGFCLTNILKYCSIISRREIIKSCMEHVEFDWMQIETKNDHEIMTRNVSIGQRLTIVCATFMYAGGFFYHAIMPIWSGKSVNERNETVRPLIYPGYDIFVDSQMSPYYEFIFYTHIVFSCVTSTITATACNLAAIFVAHACGQIELMMARLSTLFDGIEETSDLVKIRIDSIIKSHVRMLR
ncbi:uncharacterized protein [Venturia canescens]|uniref:uncharacterized protein n=1 Tax=Venturia canescens TaxID=32260 RepID=UPI001C9C7F91|nr:uncharacterized protein LOC122414747 [Venturia canescens]